MQNFIVMKHKYFIIFLFLTQACTSLIISQMMPTDRSISKYEKYKDELFKLRKKYENPCVNDYSRKTLKKLAARGTCEGYYPNQIKSSQDLTQAKIKLLTCFVSGYRPCKGTDPNQVYFVRMPTPIKNFLLHSVFNCLMPEGKEAYLQLHAALNTFTKEYPHYCDDIQLLEKLILFNMYEVKCENNTDYRHKPDGIPIRHAPYHNKFLHCDTWFRRQSDNGSFYNSILIETKAELEAPLAIAIYSKSTDVLNGYLNDLIRRGKRIPINIHTTDLFKVSSLSYAIGCCSSKMVYSLIKHAPKVAETGAIDLNEALRTGCAYGRLDIIKLLITEGADPNELNI